MIKGLGKIRRRKYFVRGALIECSDDLMIVIISSGYPYGNFTFAFINRD